MAKPAKANPDVEVLDPEPLDPEPPASPGAVKVTSVNTTTRRFVEPLRSDTAKEPDEEAWEDSEEEEALEDFFSSAQDYTIRVERISDAYAQTGQTSLRTTAGTWCDDIPLTRDYRQVIKANFGSGIYRLLLKGGTGQRIRKHQILKIAPAINSVNPQPGQSQNIRLIQPGQTFDPIAVLREQTKVVRELLSLAHEISPQQATVVNPGTSPEIAIQVAEQNGRLKMMETLLAHPDKTLSERLLTKLFPAQEESKSIWPEVVELGKVIMQELPDLIRMFAPASAAQPPTTTPPRDNPSSVAGPPSPSQLPPDTRTPSQVAYSRTMSTIIEGMVYDDLPGQSIAAIDQLLTRYEEWQADIEKMMTTDSTEVVTTWIQAGFLRDVPAETKEHWAAWIARLQGEFKSGEGESPDADDKSA